MSLPLDPASYLLRAVDASIMAADICGFALADWQVSVLQSPSRRLAMRICRQAGKSTAAALLALHESQYSPGSTTLIFAPKESQSVELFSKMLGFWRRAEPEARPERQNLSELLFSNGSRVLALPASPETVRGYTGHLLIVDEAAHLERDEEQLAAIMPMLARTGGRVIALSTPHGKRGWFYRISNDARWEQVVIRWQDCPYISREFIEEMRATLGPMRFAQEFECEFVDNETSAFATAAIEAALVDDFEPFVDAEAA